MSNIRIKDLTTTAATTASDDFVAVDGTTNGTRKLSAFSPSFGGKVAINGGDTSAAYLGLASVAGSLAINFTNANTAGQSFGIRGFAGTNSSDYVLNLRNAADSATLLKVDGAGGTTVGGNLTVSGTGTSSVAGKLNVSSAGSVFTGTDGSSISDLVANSAFGTKGNGTLTLYFGHDSTANRPFLQASTGGNAFAILLNPYGGNVLVGTTTDSSNGKLQLTSHTTSAGGIGFGTETSVYRAAAGSLVVDHIGGSAPTLNLSANGAIQSRLFFNGTSTFLESYTSHSLILRTNQTTALTLDSSQNATFAGSIKTVAPSGGTAKPWELGEAATVSPTSPNRTIRVEIDGTVYYIHAKTTND